MAIRISMCSSSLVDLAILSCDDNELATIRRSAAMQGDRPSAGGLFQEGYFLKDVCAAKRALARLFTSGKLIEGL
jgi:hypothetical protein